MSANKRAGYNLVPTVIITTAEGQNFEDEEDKLRKHQSKQIFHAIFLNKCSCTNVHVNVHNDALILHCYQFLLITYSLIQLALSKTKQTNRNMS